MESIIAMLILVAQVQFGIPESEIDKIELIWNITVIMDAKQKEQ